MKSRVSKQTRNNWLVDAFLFTSALIASLSGIYFLYLPTGGYQGGRNPWYGIVILFTRATWEDLHAWAGVLMVIAVVIHLPLHWSWVVSMTRRMLKGLTGGGSTLNARGRFNLMLNLGVAAGFILTALTGIYFLFFPSGQGTIDPGMLFSRLTWDLIHTWSGVALIMFALLHFAIHWKWVTKVTSNLYHSATEALSIIRVRPVTHIQEKAQ